MPWCPKCRSEYREGFVTCADCEVDLVDDLSPTEEPEADFDTETYLTTVADEVQANVLESLLRSFDIPVARNYREAGSYVRVFTGASSFGIDIYVPSRNLDEAKEILKGNIEIQREDSGGGRESETHWTRETKMRVMRWIITMMLLMPFLVSMVAAVIRHVRESLN